MTQDTIHKRVEDSLWTCFRLAERLAPYLAGVIAAACLGGALQFGFRYVVSDIAESRGQEPIILFGIMKIMTGTPLYTSPADVPFDITQYMPLYYYLVAYASKLLGYLPGDVREVSTVGRVLSMSFMILYLGGICFVLRRIAGCRRAICLAACSIVCLVQFPWAFLARPDAFVSLCFLGAIAATLLSLRSPSGSGRSSALMVAAGVLSFLALMTKQNGLEIIGIIVLFLVAMRDWRRACAAACAFGVPAVVAVVFWAPLFGPAMKANIVDGLKNGIVLPNACHTVYVPVFLTFNMAALSALSVPIIVGWFRENDRYEERLLGFTAVVAGCFGVLTALKLGSAANHLNDFMGFLVICIAIFVDRLAVRTQKGESTIAGLNLAVFVFVTIFLPGLLAHNLKTYRDLHNTFSGRQRILERLDEETAGHPDAYVFTNDNTLANCIPERAVLPHSGLAALATERNLIDYTRLQELIDSGQVGYCVLGFGQNPARQLGFSGMKADRYTKVDVVDAWSLWVHQSLPPPGEAAAVPE